MQERVLMVWDVYEGVRSGVALYHGVPHYFDREFDLEADQFTAVFQLWAIEPALLERVMARRLLDRGANARDEEIEDQMDRYLNSLGKCAYRVTAKFSAQETRHELRDGRMQEMTVTWLELKPDADEHDA